MKAWWVFFVFGGGALGPRNDGGMGSEGRGECSPQE